MRLMVCLLLLLLTAPARAQVQEELRREEISRVQYVLTIAQAGARLDKVDAAGARSILAKLIADLAIASHPGQEMRRRVVAALSVLDAGDLRGCNELLRKLFLEVDTIPAEELSRPAVGERIRELGRSLLGETVPTTMTAAIEDLNRRIETFPSFYRTWTRRQMEALHFACARRDLAQAQNELVVLLKGIGETAQDVTWRNDVEAVWSVPGADPAAVLAALRAFPNDPAPPVGSPYDHWARLHGGALVVLIQGTPAQKAAARQEWTISLNRLREF